MVGRKKRIVRSLTLIQHETLLKVVLQGLHDSHTCRVLNAVVPMHHSTMHQLRRRHPGGL